MTSTTSDIAVDLETSRERRLARAMSSLRTRTKATDAARVLLIVGSIAAPLGLVFIYLGWVGASRTPNLYEQIPYSISGGMLGMGLVFAGGFAYFAYWMTQLVRATQRSTAETRAVLERIESLLSGGAGTSSMVADLVPQQTYVATAKGSLYHRPDCASVAGRKGLKKVDPAKTSLSPCRICNP
jgi:CHASE3 domain sensor protein